MVRQNLMHNFTRTNCCDKRSAIKKVKGQSYEHPIAVKSSSIYRVSNIIISVLSSFKFHNILPWFHKCLGGAQNMESNKNVKSGHQNGKPKAFCRQMWHWINEKVFSSVAHIGDISWCAEERRASPSPEPKSRGEGNYATVIMAAVMFADGTNSERAPACADTRNMCIHDKYISRIYPCTV